MFTKDSPPLVGLPAQIVMIDKALAATHPEKAFYLRVTLADGVDHVDLDSAVTPIEARRKAREKGFEPTHWMIVGDNTPTQFY